ncbi:MAG TPA: hypothetical protein VH230_18955 [Stellaceae bacterium]|nr:hypothetical protein [Stellaceae bacterium]
MATGTTDTATPSPTTMATLPCCPEMTRDDTCDILDFHYRLNRQVTLAQTGAQALIPVEIKLHFRLTRCPGPFVLGNLLYTNTLFPGEKVKLFTSDRRTKFTFDSTTQLSYRNTQTTEESFFMHQMSDMLFDTSSRDSGKSSNQSHAHVDGHGDAGVDILGLGGSANMSGNFDANSLSTFLNEHSSHAQSSANAAEMGVRKSASVSVGEVQTRTHTQTESEDHYESSSREFSNPNKCHAVTFLFYQINKMQTVTYRLEAIERRVILDPTDFTRVELNQLQPSTGVGRTSLSLLATDPQARFNNLTTATGGISLVQGPATVSFPGQQPLPINLRTLALEQVDKELTDAGLLGPDGKVSPTAQQQYSFEKTSSLPTPGILVKGCLDECSICEANLEHEIELELQKKELENKLLQRQIDLLDKSQEYRCCPAGSAAEPAAAAAPPA